jgi:hypothetical protein
MESFTQDSVNRRLDETLAPALSEHGFLRHPQSPGRFQRQIEGGHQKIRVAALSSGPLAIPCVVSFEQHSERMTAIRKIIFSEFDEKWSEATHVFAFFLHHLRGTTQAERGNPRPMAVELVLSLKMVDRIIEEVLRIGLSFLNRFRTFCVDDANRFFNEPNEMTGELFKENGKSLFYIANALIYARLAGKRDFAEVVRRFERFIDTHDKYSDQKETFARIVEACRKNLLPVDGSEPA